MFLIDKAVFGDGLAGDQGVGSIFIESFAAGAENRTFYAHFFLNSQGSINGNAMVKGDSDDGVVSGPDGVGRCWWCDADDGYRAYHDREWGRPVTDDRRLFEKICLEGFQSGLSWLTILRKRQNFRQAFANFEAATLAEFGPSDIERLLQDTGIVRHRGKIVSTINNAKRALELTAEFGSLAAYFWRHEPDPSSRPAKLDRATLAGLGKTPDSIALSKDLKRRGWSFVGPTTAYAFMQAMGLVNDHLAGCAIRAEAEAEQGALKRPI